MKRVFDLFFGVAGILIVFPVLLVVGIIIRKDGGPAFFKQIRVGRNGHHFRIIKFRTMVVNAEDLGAQITSGSDPRITKIGHILRKTKLDELPQLFNVLLDQMSLVGPRPEVPTYVEKWKREDKMMILSVKPGITDYASLVYNNEQQLLADSDNPNQLYLREIMPRKLELYKKYLADKSLWLDFRIILGTLIKTIGINPVSILPELRQIELNNI